MACQRGQLVTRTALFMGTSNMPSIIEDLSVSVLLVFWSQNILQEVCAFVRRFTSQSIADVAFVAVDAIPRCCVRVSKYIPRDMLCSVSKHEIQHRSGVCDIDAVVWVFNTNPNTNQSCAPVLTVFTVLQTLHQKQADLCWSQSLEETQEAL